MHGVVASSLRPKGDAEQDLESETRSLDNLQFILYFATVMSRLSRFG
jgi:hypothetical protein